MPEHRSNPVKSPGYQVPLGVWGGVWGRCLGDGVVDNRCLGDGVIDNISNSR